MNKIKATIQRHRRIMIILASLFAIYTLIGFFATPWVAHKQLTTLLDQRLDLQTSIEKIRFNPFTFEMNVEELQLLTSADEPLIRWDELYINVDPIQLVKLDVVIDEIRLRSPRMHFHRYTSTDNTLSRLAEKWSETALPQDTEQVQETSTETGNSMMTFRLNRFNFLGGELHYQDDVPSNDFQTVLTPINISLTDFSTQPEQTANNEIVIALEKDAQLKINGNMSLAPLSLDGRVNLKSLSLQTPYRYIQAMLPFELEQGRLNLDLAYDIGVNDAEVNVKVSQIQLDVADFSILQAGDDKPLLQAGRLSLADGEFLYPQNALNVASIQLDDYTILAKRDEDGTLNWLRMLENMPQTASQESPESSTSSQFKLNVASLTSNNLQIEIEDKKPELPLNLLLNLNAELQGFNLQDSNQMPLSIELVAESGGTINLDGELQILPALAMSSELNVEDLALQPVQAYLSEFAFITLESGTLNILSQFSTNPDEPFAMQGNLALNDLFLNNQKLDEKLMSLEQLALNNIDFSLSEQNLAVSEVVVDKLYSRVKVTEEGNTNIGLLMKNSAQNQAISEQTASDNDDAEFGLSLGKVTVNDASSSFTDENLPIVFNADIKQLNGSLSSFSTSSAQPVEVALEGQVDEFGLVEINGLLNPLDVSRQTDVKLAFTNLALPGLTPYTIKFAGREVDDGAGDIDLEYKIVEGELNASNRVVIRDIRLGDRVDSPDAMDLPLDLAIALLKNSDGVIDLSIPVSGNVNDPDFDLGPVIRGAVSSAIGNIVSAPFRFLAGLFGDGGEPVEDVRFRAGRDDITPPEQEKLLQLTQALEKRPELVLRIPAPYDPTYDAEALKRKAVETRIDSKLELMTDDAQLTHKTQQVLQSLYTQADLVPSIESIKQELISASQTEDNPEGKLDVLKLNDRLKSRLIEAEPVSEASLKSLALSRQKTVMTFIQTQSDLTAERLRADESITIEASEGWIALPFKLGTT